MNHQGDFFNLDEYWANVIQKLKDPLYREQVEYTHSYHGISGKRQWFKTFLPYYKNDDPAVTTWVITNIIQLFNDIEQNPIMKRYANSLKKSLFDDENVNPELKTILSILL